MNKSLNTAGIIKGNQLHKISSISLVTGAVIMLIAGLLYPRISDPGSTQVWIQETADKADMFQISKFLLSVGLLVVMGGFMGIYRSVTERGAAWVRYGFYGIIVGTATLVVSWALIIAAAGIAGEWVTAIDKTVMYSIAVSVHEAAQILDSMGGMVWWLAFAITGIGLVQSFYPKWMGWTAVILGVVTAVEFGIITLAGTTSTHAMVSAMLSVVTIFWFLIVGIWMTRKAW
jgi:hypothetical protein